MQYSHRHNGLYLYVGRLVRPVWNLRIVTRSTVDKVQFVSIGDVNYLLLVLILSLYCVGLELIFLLECGWLFIGISFVTSIKKNDQKFVLYDHSLITLYMTLEEWTEFVVNLL
jgi:hypothetical protein